MKYRQLDRITSLEPGKRLTAERTLRADEDYLKDHFPRFPVMPGVMMLEALHQAAVWMIRTGDQFQAPLVLLREARSVKFGDFLCPGETLEIAVETVKEEGSEPPSKPRLPNRAASPSRRGWYLERCETHEPAWLETDEQVRSL